MASRQLSQRYREWGQGALLALFSAFLVLLAPFSAAPVSAASTTASSPTDQRAVPRFQVKNVSASYNANNNRIEGTFDLINPDPVSYSNLYYVATLVEEVGDGNTQDIVSQVSPNLVSFTPNQDRAFSYSLPAPVNLAPDRYTVLVQGFAESGVSVGIAGQTVKLSDPARLNDRFVNRFLDLSDAYIIGSGQKLNRLSGPNYSAGEKPQIGLTVSNSHAFAVTATPQITVYPRINAPGVAPVASVKEASITLDANSNQDLTLNLPAMNAPESYLAVLQFLDSNNQIIAGYTQYRWVVTGESGKILALKATGQQDTLHATIAATVTVVGPADGSTLSGASLEIKASSTDNPGKVIGTASQAVGALGPNPVQLSVPVVISTNPFWDVNTIHLEVSLLSSKGQLLNRSESDLPLQLTQSSTRRTILIVILVLMILALLFIFWRKQWLAKHPVIGIIIISCLATFSLQFGARSARANLSCSKVGDPTVCGKVNSKGTSIWDSPPTIDIALSPNGGNYIGVVDVWPQPMPDGTPPHATSDGATVTVTGDVTVNFYCLNYQGGLSTQVTVSKTPHFVGCFYIPGGQDSETFTPSDPEHWAKSYNIQFTSWGNNSVAYVTQAAATHMAAYYVDETHKQTCWDCTQTESASFTATCVQCIHYADGSYTGTCATSNPTNVPPSDNTSGGGGTSGSGGGGGGGTGGGGTGGGGTGSSSSPGGTGPGGTYPGGTNPGSSSGGSPSPSGNNSPGPSSSSSPLPSSSASNCSALAAACNSGDPVACAAYSQNCTGGGGAGGGGTGGGSSSSPGGSGGGSSSSPGGTGGGSSSSPGGTGSSSSPGSTTPGSTTPGSTTPGSTTPGSTTPGSTTPGSTTPGSTTPGSTTPGSTTPGSTTPGSTTPGSTTPGSTTPGGPPPPPVPAPTPDFCSGI